LLDIAALELLAVWLEVETHLLRRLVEILDCSVFVDLEGGYFLGDAFSFWLDEFFEKLRGSAPGITDARLLLISAISYM